MAETPERRRMEARDIFAKPAAEGGGVVVILGQEGAPDTVPAVGLMRLDVEGALSLATRLNRAAVIAAGHDLKETP